MYRKRKGASGHQKVCVGASLQHATTIMSSGSDVRTGPNDDGTLIAVD
jgi:hypothetical protein